VPLKEGSFFHYMRLSMLHRAVWRERGVAILTIPTRPEDDSWLSGRPDRHAVIVPVDSADILAEQALIVAAFIDPEGRRAMHFDTDPEETEILRREWKERGFPIPLEVQPAPFREIAVPVISMVRHARREADFVTVVLGEIVPRWWQRPLHPNEVRRLKELLLNERATALVTVPYAIT
jgi:hypothetical protein